MTLGPLVMRSHLRNGYIKATHRLFDNMRGIPFILGEPATHHKEVHPTPQSSRNGHLGDDLTKSTHAGAIANALSYASNASRLRYASGDFPSWPFPISITIMKSTSSRHDVPAVFPAKKGCVRKWFPPLLLALGHDFRS